MREASPRLGPGSSGLGLTPLIPLFSCGPDFAAAAGTPSRRKTLGPKPS